MEDLLQLIPLLLIALFTLLRSSRRKAQKQAKTEIAFEDEQSATLSPWEDFPTTQATSDEPLPDFLTTEAGTEAQDSVPHPVLLKDHKQPASDSDSSETKRKKISISDREKDGAPPTTTGLDTIAGVPITPQGFRQGIILSEILGRPKSLRRQHSEPGN